MNKYSAVELMKHSVLRIWMLWRLCKKGWCIFLGSETSIEGFFRLMVPLSLCKQAQHSTHKPSLPLLFSRFKKINSWVHKQNSEVDLFWLAAAQQGQRGPCVTDESPCRVPRNERTNKWMNTWFRATWKIQAFWHAVSLHFSPTICLLRSAG